MLMDNDFIRQVYYHSLTVTHKPVKYTPIDFPIKSGNGYGYGSGNGNGYGDGSGYGSGNGNRNGSGNG